ncbi:MAG: alpha/beta hydrolase family protein, partial [Acidimicrobiales bacterium]
MSLAIAVVGLASWAGVSSGTGTHRPGNQHPGTITRTTTKPDPTTTTTAPNLRSSKVSVWSQTFTDPTGAVLPTQVFYPVTSSGVPVPGAHPLIVFAEGFDALPGYYSDLLDAWAKAGFVVAAPIFPGTSGSTAPGQLNENDDLRQPAEVNFVISSLLSLNGSAGNLLYNLLDPSSIGLAGHSDGGDTVSAVSYNPCCYSSRIGATAILSGTELPGVAPGSYFTSPNPSPLLVVQGQADTINPP